MSARVDSQVYRLAVSFLDGAPQAFIETLAYELQKVCDDHLLEYEQWSETRRTVRRRAVDEMEAL